MKILNHHESDYKRRAGDIVPSTLHFCHAHFARTPNGVIVAFAPGLTVEYLNTCTYMGARDLLLENLEPEPIPYLYDAQGKLEVL